MEEIKVISKTQRIIVSPASGSVSVINAGPIGPRGFSGTTENKANGDVNTPLLVWIMQHDLNISNEEFNPSVWWFTDQDGNVMEPEAMVWVDENIALAVWDDVPVQGHWVVN